MECADVYVDFLVPALHAIGDGRAAGELTVADEHRAVAVLPRLVGRLALRENGLGRPTSIPRLFLTPSS